jgi:hypothetical protein
MDLIEQITSLIGRAEDYIASQASPAVPAPAAPAPVIVASVLPANFHFVAAERLNDQDIADVAQHLGVELAAFRAVMLTETRGSGFDHDGRPKMLFEPHIFYRLLAAQKPDVLDGAVSDDLAYQHWGAEPYPPDSYPRLLAAVDVDQELALQSASWGIGQVLGSNHKLVGYDTAVAMVADVCASERSQLAQMAAYIAATGLGPALRRRNWEAFAAGYNGRGQVATYAKELADNYRD